MIWNEENLSRLSEDARNNIIRTMEKYCDNKWWESDDPIEVAKHQIFEDICMVDFSLLHKGIELLLDRQVFTHEFVLNKRGLQAETKKTIENHEIHNDDN